MIAGLLMQQLALPAFPITKLAIPEVLAAISLAFYQFHGIIIQEYVMRIPALVRNL